MSNNAVTIPCETTVLEVLVPLSHAVGRSEATFSANFELIKHTLSEKPLRRPGRTHPLRTICNAELKNLAKRHQPPSEWFEGEEERPF